MEIKQFDNSLLTEVTELLKTSMPLDVINESLMQEKIIEDPDYNNCLTLNAYEADQLTGFIMGVIRKRPDENIGYVKLFAVHPGHRRKGIGMALYNQVETEMRASGIKKIRLFESWTNYYMPGIDPFYTEAVCFFERNKFKKVGDTSNLVAELKGKDFSTNVEEKKLKDEGIEIRRAEESDFDEMMKWIDQNFAAWRGEVTNTFKNKPISLHIALTNNEIIAFSAHEANNLGLGWFGPMGTTEAARGKGVGGILLKRCIADMQKMGYKKAIIPWVGPIPFYMHYIGSKVGRIFWRYEKVLG